MFVFLIAPVAAVLRKAALPVLTAILLASSGVAGAESGVQTSPESQSSVLLVMGDSLSAAYGIKQSDGWVALLEKRLARKGYDQRVVNASISGETTGGGLRRLPALLARHSPKIVIVELGANDGLRGQPLGMMRSNLVAMVKASQEQGARVLLLGMRLPPNYGPEYAIDFHDSYEQVAKETEAELLPFFLDGVALDRSLFQEDGIHPTAAAQKRLLNNVWEALRPLIGEPPETNIEDDAAGFLRPAWPVLTGPA